MGKKWPTCMNYISPDEPREASIALRGLLQLLHDRMGPKCRASEEIRNVFYKCSHGKSARTKARTI